MARFLGMKLKQKGILSVRLAGEVGAYAPDMKIYNRILSRIINPRMKPLASIHFDFREIEYVTDPGIGLFIKLYVEAKRMGVKEIRFINVKSRQKDKFRQMGIDRVFIIE